MDRFLYTYLLARWQRAWLKLTVGQFITLGLFLVVGVGFGFGLYYALVRGLSHVAADPFLGVALPAFIYQLFLLVTIGLVVISSLVSGLFGYYRHATDVWFMVSPKFRWLIWIKAFSISAFSLWPVALVAVPLVVALQTVFSIGVTGLLIGFVIVTLAAVVAVLVSLTWLLFLSWTISSMLPHTRYRFGSLLGATLISVIFAVLYVLMPFQSVSLIELFQAQNLTLATAPLDDVLGLFTHIPTYGVGMGLLSLQLGLVSEAIAYCGLLLLVLLLTVLIYSRFATLFLSLWQFFSEGVVRADVGSLTPMTVTARTAVSFGNGGSVWALCIKEALLLWRSGKELLWLGFLLFLWVVVTSFDVLMSQLLVRRVADDVVSETVLALQLTVIAYFTAAIVLRFVFPAFSTERDTGWRILAAPLRRDQWLFAKGLFYVLGLLCITLCISILHSMLIVSSVSTMVSFLIFALGQAIVLTSIGLCLGAWFPSFTTTDPQRLSTTLPGLLFTFGAIGYGALTGWVFYLWLTSTALAAVIVLIVASIVGTLLIGRYALRAFVQQEFVGHQGH